MLVRINILFVFVFSIMLFGCNKNKVEAKYSAKYELSDIPYIDHFKIFNEQVIDKNLKEVSGLVTSRNQQGFVYMVEDRSNKNAVYVFNKEGGYQGKLVLQGVENIDWEDLAIGPGPTPGKNYIYVADIGDNDAVRENVRVIRFEEPNEFSFSENKMIIQNYDVITFEYPDGARDAETLLIDPKNLQLIVITKREAVARVYALGYPYTNKELDFIGLLPMQRLLGGDVSPSGNKVLLKNKSTVYYWSNVGDNLLKSLFKTNPVSVFYIKEPQGESIGFTSDEKGYMTITETSGHSGAEPILYHYIEE